ncbi:phosphoribosylformylglycinamidine synthase [Plesiocystis pacifica SIR-1]|uniref:Phosphoribosylformylglycinamidine synthase n=1 Tax=Plesiocystis pacifica SIR-1 TaxID=391625 RepID=A6G365_9BACT|nr:phosphoribosylformylglycinamidine synthase subunit PurQ [Plesiocystis pacifica]EDM79690.1 phosphoribosylformylglycinamidine synthase [Plesiocystis pacifica SIR-1]
MDSEQHQGRNFGTSFAAKRTAIMDAFELDGAAEAVRVLVPTGYGLNCEAESAAAFELLGAQVEQVHVSDLLAEPGRLSQASILVFIGGFSFGDHVASGRVFANRMRFGLGRELARFIADGGLAVGMCNGFQVMTKLGLLPGALGEASPEALAPQQVSIVGNDRLGYRNAWVRMRVDPESPCVWTRGVESIESPSRHGEGKLVFASDAVRDQLFAERRVPVRYVDAQGEATSEWPANPNGSPDGAAGLCDASGRVFGLMPHPEAFLYPENHPRWLARRFGAEARPAFGLGLQLYANGVRAATQT